MDDAIVAASADDVRATIAALWLGDSATPGRLGDVRLAAHQAAAVARIQDAFDEFGGALLCDVVGSGKTYIGAAIAAGNERPLIICPAALRTMWVEALRKTAIDARLINIETLSRCCPASGGGDLLVVDEAHHFRNPATLRHQRLAALVSGRRVLLMTATPIHNSRRDLVTLAGLFLGERARRLSDAELARLVIRRERSQVVASTPIPEAGTTEWLVIGDDPAVAQAVMALPPAVPLRESGEAAFLAAHGLLRQWASSEAALRTALKRRLARARALESSLESGGYPSEAELQSWLAGEDSIQLGFEGLLASVRCESSEELGASVQAHAAELRKLLCLVDVTLALDDRRAEFLRAIRAAHPGAQIVAFASYEATIRALFERLASSGRVAGLTSAGGCVAGGKVGRAEILEQFVPDGKAAPLSDRIELLLTTDLLSEGVNLQKASVAVHLDLPWTPARLEQRVGRIARIGSLHSRVTVYGFCPPKSAETVLRSSALLGAKWRAAAEAIGRGAAIGLDIAEPADATSTTAAPAAHERLRAIIGGWRGSIAGPPKDVSHPIAAAVHSTERGFIALLECHDGFRLLCCDGTAISENPSHLERACRGACGRSLALNLHSAQRALVRIRRWTTARSAADDAGLGSSAFLRSRRRILERIDSVGARTPPHARPLRGPLIQKARRAATAAQTGVNERELALLAGATDLSDEAWLQRIAEIGSRGEAVTDDRKCRIRALLILTGPGPKAMEPVPPEGTLTTAYRAA